MKVDFFNIRLDIMNHAEAIEKCSWFLNSRRCKTIFFLNAHCFNIAQQNQEYAKAINEADLLLNDGFGIKLASFVAGVSLKQNMNGTDLIPKILSVAAERGQSVFFMGAMEGVAENAAKKIKKTLPQIKVVGWHSGYFDKQQEEALIEKINQSEAKMLLLGMGVPMQELWAVRNMHRLRNVRVIIGGGAILDFISGQVNRAPLWIRKINMEWAYRFYLEPRRMSKRYTTGILLFFFNIIRLSASRKMLVKSTQ